MDKLQLYTDSYGLVSNALVPPGTIRASDNGVLFTSEAMILGLTLDPKPINACIDDKKQLHRAPNDTSTDAPDDYIGLLSAISYGCKINCPNLVINVCQPVIVYMWVMAKYGPMYHLLSPLAALILLFSNVGEDKSATSDKLLSWCIFKGVSKRSWLCNLAGKLWTYRMKKIYGSTKAIAEIYFGANHPFVLNWKE